MKTQFFHQRSIRGYALLLTMIFVGLCVLLLGTIMNWTSETSRLSDRDNEYYSSAAAAEAATEKVLVHISRDYLNSGDSAVSANLGNYGTMLPTGTEYYMWTNYTFYNPQTGATNGIYVNQYQGSTYQVLTGEYSGLSGYQSIYRIIANAGLNNSRNVNLRAGVQQYIGTDAIPLFQFAIFYNQDLEMNPNPAMTVTGRVHSNGNIYTLPTTSLTFSNDVTATGTINLTNMPGDPDGNRGITGAPNVIFDGQHEGGASALNMPIGTNSIGTNVYAMLQVPPTGESPTSQLGSQRMYNKSDLLILVSNGSVTMKSGPALGSTAVTITNNVWTNFLVITNLMYDARQEATNQTIQLDIGKFNAWVTNLANPLSSLLSAADQTDVNTVYIADLRTGTGFEPGVYLKNGAELPPAGLTISTPDPVYIQGDYNVTTDGANFSKGVNSTTYTVPSAVMGDAITILSDNWNPATDLTKPSTMPTATSTTVNTALLVGIVPTGDYNGVAAYSGGVENFPRFLEDWSKGGPGGGASTFWYNGSMVAMFDSQIATMPWNYNGNKYYNPPIRNWAFDVNFNNPAKLPPATPLIVTMQRLGWAFQAPGVVPP